MTRLTDVDLCHVLSCDRRRYAIEYVYDADSPVETGELATAVAAAESGVSPPPASVRDSVAASLRATHIPTLTEFELLTEHPEAGTVAATPATRHAVRRLREDGPFGVRWSETYRALGLGGLCAVTGAAAGVPLLAALDPLIPAVTALVAYAAASIYHVWTLRPRGPDHAAVWRPADDPSSTGDQSA